MEKGIEEVMDVPKRDIQDIQVERFPQWYQQRRSNITKGQKQVLERFWPTIGKSEQRRTLKFGEKVNMEEWFETEQETKRWLDIGFGTGESLLQLARTHPQDQFVGCEIYRPGHALVAYACEEEGIKNVRLIGGDARKFLTRQCPLSAFDVVNVYFPDPFAKEKATMRLVNDAFWPLISPVFKLHRDGLLHIATDVGFYLKEILAAYLSLGVGLGWRLETVQRSAGPKGGENTKEEEEETARQVGKWLMEHAPEAKVEFVRDSERPLTHFERIAVEQGRFVWDIKFWLRRTQ